MLINEHSPYLSVKSDSVGLALGANTAGPRWMLLAAWLNLAAQILKIYKLSPVQSHLDLNLLYFVTMILLLISAIALILKFLTNAA